MRTRDDLKAFIASTLKLPSVDDDSAMGSVRGWDSLRHIELIMALQAELGISIPPDRIGELASVAALAAFLVEEGQLEG